jgi:phosphatidyl-myo-inositol dimannoside synthase
VSVSDNPTVAGIARCVPCSVALWATQLAARGGVQAYMWRLWEMLATFAPGGAPSGVSLLDTDEELARWRHPIPSRPVGAQRSRLRFFAAAIANARSCDVVIVGHPNIAPVALFALWLRIIDKYYVVIHGVEAWRRLSWLKRIALGRARSVVATTRYTARLCASLNDLSFEHFSIIPLCGEPRPVEASSDFALDGPFPILFVGRLARTERAKGLVSVMDAVATLSTKGIRLKLHVIGDGDDRVALGHEALQRGLTEEHVQFHGRVDDAQLQAAYRSARVFVMPSGKEGFGIVFIEAMRHGVPCIGGNEGGTPEVITADHEGFLVAPGDASELVTVLEELVGNEPKRLELGRQARLTYVQRYTFQEFAAQWTKFLAANGGSR